MHAHKIKRREKRKTQDLERTPFVKIGPFEITLPHGFYGVMCFIAVAVLSALFTKYNVLGVKSPISSYSFKIGTRYSAYVANIKE